MNVVEFLKESKRLCASFKYCKECPVYVDFSGCAVKPLVGANEEKTEAIIEEWSRKHPVKTRQSEFLKMFPRADITVNGVIKICPNAVEMGYVDMKDCNFSTCLECQKAYWLAEVEKPNTNLINREDVIKVVDKHTNEDGTLDEDISVILEETS